MNAPFEYDYQAAVDLCKEYSDNPELLESVIKKLKIDVGPLTIVPSPFQENLKALQMRVVVNGISFCFNASHNDAMLRKKIISGDWRERTKFKREWEKFRNGLLYSLLCCIKSDITAAWNDPEELGINPDSIKDMAEWNRIKEHSKKLFQGLKLTQEEIDSLPS